MPESASLARSPAPPPAVEPFITAPFSTALDVIRFCAAALVLVCHAAQMKFYSGWFPDAPLTQHYAVVVFFVLSGLVITASTARKPTTFGRFMVARMARILPVSLAAILFSTAAFVLVTSLGGSAQHTDTYGRLSLAGTVLPMLFLSESAWGAGPVWNPPYWSLCYEVWYYALFGAAVLLRGPARIGAILLFAGLAGPRVLLMLPIWLVGVGLVLSPAVRRIGPALGAILLAAGMAAAWLHTDLVLPGLRLMRSLVAPIGLDLSYSRFALSDFVLALAVATAFAGLRALVNRWPQPWQAIATPARRLAGFSFTLYLFHWPVLLLAKSANVTPQDSLIGFVLSLGLILALCHAISYITEQQRERVRPLLERWFLRTTPGQRLAA